MKPDEMWETWKVSWEFLLHVLIVVSPFALVGGVLLAIFMWTF